MSKQTPSGPDPIHDPNQLGVDQPVETIRQQIRDAPEVARAVEKRDQSPTA